MIRVPPRSTRTTHSFPTRRSSELSTEVWEFINEASMHMMGSMPHPLHVHGVQFRIIDRRVHPSAMAAWRSVSDGYVDEGWKDTALVIDRKSTRLNSSH